MCRNLEPDDGYRMPEPSDAVELVISSLFLRLAEDNPNTNRKQVEKEIAILQEQLASRLLPSS